MADNNQIVKVGRRKCSVAVAKVVSGKGRILRYNRSAR